MVPVYGQGVMDPCPRNLMNPSDLNNYMNTGFHILGDSIASKCLVVRVRSKRGLNVMLIALDFILEMIGSL